MNRRKYLSIFVLLFMLITTPTWAKGNKDKLQIACINIDYVLKHYTSAQALEKAFSDKTDVSKALTEQKSSNFEKLVTEFQDKINENAFLSESCANQEYDRIKKAESDLKLFADSITTDLKKQREKTDILLEKLIIDEIKKYNRDKKYQLIYNSKGLSSILYADEEYDITSDFLEFINQRTILEQ